MNFIRTVTLFIHIYLLRAQSALALQQESAFGSLTTEESAFGSLTTEESQYTTNHVYVSRVSHYGAARPTTQEPDIRSTAPPDIQAIPAPESTSKRSSASRQPDVYVKYMGLPSVDGTTEGVGQPEATTSKEELQQEEETIAGALSDRTKSHPGSEDSTTQVTGPNVITPEVRVSGRSGQEDRSSSRTTSDSVKSPRNEDETGKDNGRIKNIKLEVSSEKSEPKTMHVTLMDLTTATPEVKVESQDISVTLPDARKMAPNMKLSPNVATGRSSEPEMAPASKPSQYRPPFWNVSQPVNVQQYERFLPQSEVKKNYLWSQDRAVFLTPYIEQQQYNEARQKSRIEFVDNYRNPSYSGYLTINATCDSNLFFWFFPSKKNSDVAPVILWMTGGPGDSSLLGAFGGVGPVTVNENLTLEENENSLTSKFNVLFIDIPVGSGYSYASSAECNARNSMDVADQLYQGLMQFFTIFFDLHDNGFYIAGEGHASAYACTLGYLIHFQNAFAPFDIRFTGILGVSPIIDYSAFVNVSEQAFSLGLISEWERNYMRTKQSAVLHLIQQREYSQAMDQFGPLFLGLLWPHQTAFQAFSGLKNLDSADGVTTNLELENKAVDYLNLASVRQVLRVSNNISSFEARRQPIVVDLYADVMKSYSLWAEFLLNSSYKFLLIHGQLDLLVSPPAFEGFVNSLKWRWSDFFLRKSRFIWEVQNGTIVAGYGRKAENLATMDILASGHRVTIDQPGLSLETINWFINNEPLGGFVESDVAGAELIVEQ